MNNKEILCVLSLADFTFQDLDLNLPFFPLLYHCFHNSLVDCTKEAAVHQHGEKNSRQLFFNISSWSYFFCHGSVNTAKQGGGGFLICCHLSIAVWKHDNQSSGHTFLYVWTARILMYTYKSWCIYTNLDVNLRILCIYTNLDVYIRILLYIYESWCIYTNLDVYIRILMYIYESCCVYTNLDVYITVLSCKFMVLLFCPFSTSIVRLQG